MPPRPIPQSSRIDGTRSAASAVCASTGEAARRPDGPIASRGPTPFRGTYPGPPVPMIRSNASSTLAASPFATRSRPERRPAEGRPLVRRQHAAARSSTARPAARAGGRPSAANRSRRWARWAASSASKASSSGSTPRPSRCSSPGQKSREPPVTRVDLDARPAARGPAGIAPGSAASSRGAASVSWSVIARVRTPTAAAAATSSRGVRTPSERRVWVCRSTGDGPGGTTGAPGTPRRVRAIARPSGLDDLLDPLDGEGPPGRRVDVDLGRR